MESRVEAPWRIIKKAISTNAQMFGWLGKVICTKRKGESANISHNIRRSQKRSEDVVLYEIEWVQWWLKLKKVQVERWFRTVNQHDASDFGLSTNLENFLAATTPQVGTMYWSLHQYVWLCSLRYKLAFISTDKGVVGSTAGNNPQQQVEQQQLPAPCHEQNDFGVVFAVLRPHFRQIYSDWQVVIAGQVLGKGMIWAG